MVKGALQTWSNEELQDGKIKLNYVSAPSVITEVLKREGPEGQRRYVKKEVVVGDEGPAAQECGWLLKGLQKAMKRVLPWNLQKECGSAGPCWTSVSRTIK